MALLTLTKLPPPRGGGGGGAPVREIIARPAFIAAVIGIVTFGTMNLVLIIVRWSRIRGFAGRFHHDGARAFS